MTAVDDAADELYGLPPEEFVPRRDELVAAAREEGRRDDAKAIGRLRRPTQAAWLANLLARERAEQLDGLLDLAAELSTAQRTLDGPSLRALSSQRNKLVAAMAREARRLAAGDGHRITEPTERDLRGILDAALADPGVAEEVRSGRLTRTVTYSGFGPAEGTAAPAPRPHRPAGRPDRNGRTAPDTAPEEAPDEEHAETGRREAEERRRRERAEARRRAEEALEQTRQEARRAADRHEDAVAEAEQAAAERDRADRRVDELTEALEQAREERAQAVEAAKHAAQAERFAARAARDAATEVDWAQARLDELDP